MGDFSKWMEEQSDENSIRHAYSLIINDSSLQNRDLVVSKYMEPPIIQHLYNLDNPEDRRNGSKPRGGLWYGLGTRWIEHLSDPSISGGLKVGKYIHELFIDKSKVFVLDSEKKNEELKKRFGFDVGYQDDIYSTGIRYDKMAKYYAGIEYPAYGITNFMDEYYVYFVEIPSGCIWDKSALKASRLLYYYDDKTGKFIKSKWAS